MVKIRKSSLIFLAIKKTNGGHNHIKYNNIYKYWKLFLMALISLWIDMWNSCLASSPYPISIQLSWKSLRAKPTKLTHIIKMAIKRYINSIPGIIPHLQFTHQFHHFIIENQIQVMFHLAHSTLISMTFHNVIILSILHSTTILTRYTEVK